MKLIKNGMVLNSEEHKFYKQDVLIDNDKICEIGNLDEKEYNAEIIDAEGLYVLPAFIDIHTHGAMGEDFLDADVNGLSKLLDFYKKNGTKSVYATTVTAPKEKILTAIKNIREAAKKTPDINVEGIHIEGPFISTKQPGCHMISEIRNPSIAELDEICDAVGDMKLRITVAPELEGAEEFIKEAVRRGINIGIGHTNADAETVKKALSWGANVIIHLYNTMTALHHRKPGCVGIGLLSDAYTELIVDGHHINPDVVALTYKVKGNDRLVLITDSMQATGMPDGKYSIGGIDVVMSNGVVATQEGQLAGSTLTLPNAVKNLMEFSGATLADAVICATLNPAKVVGIDNVTGSIKVGKRADIILADQSMQVIQAV